MSTDRHLSPRERKWAIEHAVQTHLIAEEQRQLAAGCTSLDELRATLIEAGLPEVDVDQALATLDQALEQRRRAVARQRNLGLLFAVAFAAAAAAGYLVTAAPTPGPLVFVNVRHDNPGQQPFHSWEGGSALGGGAELHLARSLAAAGLPVVDQLDAKALRRLFVGSGLQPSRPAVRAATVATLAALGDAPCVQVGGEPGEGPKTMRVNLSLQVIELGSGAALLRDSAEGVASAAQVTSACDQAATRAAESLSPRLIAQLTSRLGLSPAQETP